MTARTIVRHSMDAPVREAEPSDWPSVNSLLVELGRPNARAAPDEDAAGRRAFARYLRRPDTAGFVAESATGLVGFIDVELRNWLSFPGVEAWIPDLIVTEPARGRGVGSALLRRAEEFARAAGCWGIALESANWRAEAHAFYVSHGWSQVALHFEKSLREEHSKD